MTLMVQYLVILAIKDCNCLNYRYCNLFPFDKNIVSLGDSSRYINASWIRFPEFSYIATMGPMLPSSFSSKRKPDSGGADDTCMGKQGILELKE